MHAVPILLAVASSLTSAAPVAFDAVSAKSGPWSDPATWGGRPPAAGDRVRIRSGDRVVYDLSSGAAVRIVHVAGTLTFSRDHATTLEAGLIRISPGSECSEDGFDCHDEPPAADGPVPALEIGTPEAPIPAGVTATIRLKHFEGMNAETLPAIVACGGRWDVHGAPVPRTWLKLDATAPAGSSRLTLELPPAGWKAGDRIIITGSREDDYQEAQKSAPAGGFAGATEERTIVRVEERTIVLDRPLTFVHFGEGMMRSEAALLSRNVIVESSNPDGIRGHTMYHRDSSGGISYAEFRHLGKRGVLGKYAIHFHLVRDSMRGSGVTGASIHHSDNRWITIHGTDHLLVRDCVGYRSRGHGFFLEDASEQWNILDRNLAVQAIAARPLPKQALPFDPNDGAGFWWASARNTLTRNTACENENYGFHYELRKSSGFDPVLRLRDVRGEPGPCDVRTLPFLRFEDNESHTEGLYSFNFGDDRNGEIHGDREHPFIVRNLRAWETHYVLRPNVRFFLCENLKVKNAVYGIYHPDYDAHVYRDVQLDSVTSEPINRGHDDESIQYGDFTFERLTLTNCRPGRDPIIQLACTAPKPGVTGYFRDLRISDCRSPARIVDLGGGPRNDRLQHPVTYCFLNDDSRTAGLPEPVDGHVKVTSRMFPDALKDGDYREIPGFTGRDVRAAVAERLTMPVLVDPKDDLPPATLITAVQSSGSKLLVRGVTHDNGTVAAVSVNGTPATITAQQSGVADWQAEVAVASEITASARDTAGNTEQWPHRIPAR